MEGKKRKREEEQPLTVVTFSTSQNRTFDRVLRDQSFSEVKGIVRKKLGLEANAKLSLVQLRDGKEVDLEDEDDYDAFRTLSRTIPNLHVVVRVGNEPSARPQAVNNGTTAQTMSNGARPVTISSTQPVAGPSSRTLDTVNPEEEDELAAPPPRKKHKSSTGAGPSSPAPDASAATEAPAAPPLKKRKKKHKAREMSSGSAADLSSNLPEIPADGTIHPPQKPSGPFIVDSTEPSCAVSPEPTPATQLAEKAKKKKKAAVEKSNADPSPPTATEVATAEQSPPPKKKKKRIAQTGDETDQPLAKKTKKPKVAEQPATTAPAPDASVSALHPAEQVEPTAKAKKKSKKGKEPDTTIADQPAQSVNGVSVPPAAAPAPAKAAKKKSSAAAMVAAATALPNPPINAEVQEKPKKSKKTKARKDTEAAAVAGDKTHEADSTQDKTGSSNKEAEGLAEPEAKPKKSQKAKEKPPKVHVVDIEDDFFAAISAVLGKNSADRDKDTHIPNHVAALPGATASEVLESADAVVSKEPASKKSSTARKQPAKSRLSTSWGPADITDGSATSEALPEKETAPDVEDTSISVAISRAHERASAAAPKAPAVAASLATADNPTVEETSASHAPSATHPARRISGVISAGTQFSEVPIQGHDEGSSDDSDDENDEQEVEANTTLPLSDAKTPVSRFNSASNSTNLSEVDVEALLRGPMPRKSILSLLPSDSSSEEEKSESEDEDNELASEEEEKQEQAYRRMSKRFERHAPSSSDEEPIDDEELAAMEKEEQPTASPSPAAEGLEVGDGPNSVESPAPVAVEEPNLGLPDLPSSPSADVKLAEDKVKPQEDAEISSPSTPAHAPEIAEDEVVPTSDPAEVVEGEVKADAPVDVNGPIEGQQGEDHEVDQVAETPQSSQTVPEEFVAEQHQDASEPHEQDEELKVEIVPVQRRVNGRAPAKPSQEDPEDPIEPSEDFDAPPGVEAEDPIELDEAEVPERPTTPPASPMKPGQAKRMKDRNGKLPSEVQPTSQPVPRSTRASSRQPEATGERAETAPPALIPEEDAPPESSQTAAPARRSSRTPPQEPSAETSSSSLVPVPEPSAVKRRGRPPKSAEEKAMIAAEKEAEKKRKAEEKEQEKQKKAAEKKAAAEEKARLKAEKATAAKAKKSGAAKKAAADDKAKDVEEPEVEPVSARFAATQPTPETASSAKAPLSALGASAAQWTPLSQASSIPDADTSMVDELRSSTPDAALSAQLNSHQVNEEQPEEEGESQEHDPVQDSEDESPTIKMPNRPSTQPLFAPSDSQHPDATLYHSSQPILSSVQQSQQSSQSQEKFKRPAPSFKAQFRRLSDIASQELFSPRSPLSSVPMPTQRRQTIATAEDRRASMYGDLANPGSDSSSDSEDEPISHIPKHRRAGVQKEMFVE